VSLLLIRDWSLRLLLLILGVIIHSLKDLRLLQPRRRACGFGDNVDHWGSDLCYGRQRARRLRLLQVSCLAYVLMLLVIKLRCCGEIETSAPRYYHILLIVRLVVPMRGLPSLLPTLYALWLDH
jgi:hypothetical protein